MQGQSKFAITPIAAAVTAAMYPGHAAMAQDDQSGAVLEEIIVTATKRAMSTQDIPATVQAITQESLASMGAKGMDDYARFIPSVNVVTYSAGSSTVVFRGAITGAGYLGQSTSSVYLDEISITNTGSQPQIRMVDIARVEALSGPQGTLYGSDAQAGTMRIITNQPVMNSYEAIFDGEVRGGDESDMSYRGSLVFNIPLVEDKLALRVAGYMEEDGGFVDNVFGHTADSSALGKTWRPENRALPLYEHHGVLNNQAVVDENWNEAEVSGVRAHLRWEMSDDWALTGTAFTQSTDSGGGNYYDPFVGDLEVVRFHDDKREEDFNMFSMVLEGDLGFAQIVAAASYYEREVSGVWDITNYAHYWSVQYCHDGYYQAAVYGPYYFANPDTGYYVWAAYCQGASVDGDYFSTYPGPSQDDKFTTEIRLSSQGDTIDWILGFYYEDSKDSWQAPFATPTTGGDGSVNTFQDSPAAAFWEFYFANYYGTPATTLAGATSNWYSESSTDWEQKAVFGEVTWHMTDSLNLTLGGRYFERENTNYYIVNHPGGISPTGGFGTNGEPDYLDADPDDFRPGTSEGRQARLAAGLDNPIGRSGKDEEFIPKVSLSWGVTDDTMLYGLYTQGKRPGGVNRSRGQPAFPNKYDPDIMDNYEMGYKSNFADGRGRFNVTAYHMLWGEYQLEQVDPASDNCTDPDGTPNDDKIPFVCGQPWQQVIGNAGDAHITGVNFELDYAISENWLIGGNFEKMEAEVDTPQDTNNDGEPNLTKGLKLPLVPEFKASAWLEYTAPSKLFGSENWFFRTQWSVTGESLNILEPLPTDDPNPQFKNDSYTIGDVRVGLQGEDWEASMFINNVTDERATYTHGTGLFEWAQAQSAEGRAHHQTLYVNRPLEVGVRFMKRWGD